MEGRTSVQPESGTLSPTILTCAVVGSIVTGNPNQPRTREEVIASAVEAAHAGASVLHIHARSSTGEITQSPADFAEIKRAIRAEVDDILLNFTTGGKLGMSQQERRRSLEVQPDIATLNCGTINFGPGDEIFMNPKPLIRDLAAEMDRRDIVREYECFDVGMAVMARSLAEAAPRAPGIMHLVVGVVGGAPANVNVIRTFADLVPSGVPWLATGVGRHNFPTMALSVALGGHARTGLEDVLYVAPGEHARSNAQLVTRARSLCEAIGRPVATPHEARVILGLERS